MPALGVREGRSLVALAQRAFGLLVSPLCLCLNRERSHDQQNALAEERDHEELLHDAEQVTDAAGVVQAAVGLGLLGEVLLAAEGDAATADEELVPHGLEFGGCVVGGVVVAEGVGDSGDVVVDGRVEKEVGRAQRDR